MADELISRQVFIKGQCNSCDGWCEDVNCDCLNCKSDRRCVFIKDLADEPAVDAVELTAAELKYLINDTIAYIWKMEDSGRNKPEFGYDSRKALLEKLQRFEKEHFPEMGCSNG